MQYKKSLRLKWAAYCRVSTDSDEQATSYEMQVEHYTEYITKNPEWELVGIYADDGISGTNTKAEEFNRMIEDCLGKDRHDHHKIHKPICQKYIRLPTGHPKIEG